MKDHVEQLPRESVDSHNLTTLDNSILNLSLYLTLI